MGSAHHDAVPGEHVIVSGFARFAGEFGQLARKNHEATASFHHFSVAVWTIWLILNFCGMLMGTPAIDLSANAVFGTALIGAGTIGLILYLRGDGRRA